MKKIQMILVTLFLVSVYVGFLYTLSMMTDITLLNFYQDFLDPSVKTYVNQAQEINQLIFRLSLFLVVITVIFYGFKTKKALYRGYKVLSALIVGLLTLGIHIFMWSKLVTLNKLYLNTDTSWPADYPLTAEQLGYVEPGHFFIGIGPMTLLVLSLIAACLVIFMGYLFISQRKESKR